LEPSKEQLAVELVHPELPFDARESERDGD
jgi:hypothetical protein